MSVTWQRVRTYVRCQNICTQIRMWCDRQTHRHFPLVGSFWPWSHKTSNYVDLFFCLSSVRSFPSQNYISVLFGVKEDWVSDHLINEHDTHDRHQSLQHKMASSTMKRALICVWLAASASALMPAQCASLRRTSVVSRMGIFDEIKGAFNSADENVAIDESREVWFVHCCISKLRFSLQYYRMNTVLYGRL